MAEVIEKCPVCGALLDEEDLFCANCGTEAPHREAAGTAPKAATSTHNFLCDGCGASMSYDASAQTLRCPFCGSEKMTEQQDVKMLAPQGIVPLTVDHGQAMTIMRGWLGRGFWRPGDLASTAAVTKITPVYVPYWVFAAGTHTYWTADSSQTPPGARGEWVPLSGEHHGNYANLLIGASGVLTPNETRSLCPFDLAQAVPPEQVDTDNIIVEQFRVQRKYARPLAHQGLEELERAACQQYVPGSCRNLKVNVVLKGLSSYPVLLPVWVMAYRYREQVFRFLINGQTGRATGQAPVSWTKVAAAIAIVAVLALLLFLAIAAYAGAPLIRSENPAVPAPAVGQRANKNVDEIWFGNQFCKTIPWTRTRTAMGGAVRRSRPWTSAAWRRTTTVICGPAACPKWSDSARSTSGCWSPSTPRGSAAIRLATSCSTARRGWGRPPSPCASRASWALACSWPVGRV